ncbi:MAG TPA: hypothetical protein VMI75_07590 [Polyangiaceae bacterium]|nr:hypothetical protein [Polyangiaceae bacterium]
MTRSTAALFFGCVPILLLILLFAALGQGCATGRGSNDEPVQGWATDAATQPESGQSDAGSPTPDAIVTPDAAPETGSGCGSNADCVQSPGKVCSQGACVACVNDTTCSAPTPRCDVGTSTCVACLASTDCMPGYVCGTNDTCQQGCSASQPCPTGQVCNAGGCVQCVMDSDCGGATPRCDTKSNTCVQCLQTMDNCGTGQFCSGTTCTAGCKNNGDCAAGDAGASAPLCDVSHHECVQCLGDGDCPASQICSPSNNCTTGCNSNHPCAGGLTCCSGFCESLDTTANCGACGITCDTTSGHSLGASCSGTTCVYAGCATGWHDCNAATPNSDGCETNLTTQGKKVCGDGVCVAVSTCCTASDCLAPPSPQACYGMQGTCVEGSPCSYPLNQGSTVCGSTCCNAIDGTCNTSCSLTCNTGRENCSGNPATGCDTDVATTAACGGCGRECSSANTATEACAGGVCNATCQAGWGNCSQPAAPAADDGCESDLTVCAGTPCCGSLCTGTHSDGIGQTYTSCVALGQPGNPATYTKAMAIDCLNADPITGGGVGTKTCPDPGGGTDDCYYNSCSGSTCPTGVTAECGVWCYTGGLAGYVKLTGGSTTCNCPTTSDATWN